MFRFCEDFFQANEPSISDITNKWEFFRGILANCLESLNNRIHTVKPSIIMKNSIQPAAVLSVESEAANRIFSQSKLMIALVKSSPMGPPEPEGTRQVVISLPVGGKLLNFNRKSGDMLSQVLSRMRISCAKALKESAAEPAADASPARKVQKGVKSPLPQPDIMFMSSASGVVAEMTLGGALEVATGIKVDMDEYQIVLDPPVVTTLELENHIWTGFPVVATWSCSGAREEEFEFEWRIVSPTSNEVVESIKGGQVFTPSPHHTGHFLEVRCFHPRFPQFYLSHTSLDRIADFPDSKCARLDAPLPTPSRDIIRVATFNILAQPYMRTPLAQDNYYTHLYNSWHITEWTRRCPLIMREMIDTDSDVYCLQEVAGGAHETQIKRLLSATHDWHFFGKESLANNGNPIGVSISLRRDKFEVITESKFNLGVGDDGLFNSMLTEAEREGIRTQFGELFFGPVLKGIHTVAGIVHARSKTDGRDILVANTHLFFHPFGGHIRILQGLCLMRKLAELRAAIARPDYPLPAVIVCGDFNSRPDSGSFKVMSSGSIEAANVDWQYGRSFRSEKYATEGVADGVLVGNGATDATPPGDGDEAATATVVTGVELPPVHGLDLTHTLDNRHVPSKVPELTHATASFRSTLDYIFYSGDVLEAMEGEGTGSSLPELTNSDVNRMGGLPFDYYGSDHVLVCGDLRLRQ